MFHLSVFILISLIVTNHAEAILQNPKLTNMEDGFLELKRNGTLILRTALNNSSSLRQEAIVFKTILNAIRLMPLQAKNATNDMNNKKMYGEGVEHKFPPFLERVIQRIQTYFSVYKYTDTSKPLQDVKKPISPTTAMSSSVTATSTTSSGIPNKTLTLSQNEIDVDLTNSNNVFNRNNKTLLSMNKFKSPSTTTTKPTVVSDKDEENEFVEIKKYKNT